MGSPHWSRVLRLGGATATIVTVIGGETAGDVFRAVRSVSRSQHQHQLAFLDTADLGTNADRLSRFTSRVDRFNWVDVKWISDCVITGNLLDYRQGPYALKTPGFPTSDGNADTHALQLASAKPTIESDEGTSTTTGVSEPSALTSSKVSASASSAVSALASSAASVLATASASDSSVASASASSGASGSPTLSRQLHYFVNGSVLRNPDNNVRLTTARATPDVYSFAERIYNSTREQRDTGLTLLQHARESDRVAYEPEQQRLAELKAEMEKVRTRKKALKVELEARHAQLQRLRDRSTSTQQNGRLPSLIQSDINAASNDEERLACMIDPVGNRVVAFGNRSTVLRFYEKIVTASLTRPPVPTQLEVVLGIPDGATDDDAHWRRYLVVQLLLHASKVNWLNFVHGE